MVRARPGKALIRRARKGSGFPTVSTYACVARPVGPRVGGWLSRVKQAQSTESRPGKLLQRWARQLCQHGQPWPTQSLKAQRPLTSVRCTPASSMDCINPTVLVSAIAFELILSPPSLQAHRLAPPVPPHLCQLHPSVHTSACADLVHPSCPRPLAPRAHTLTSVRFTPASSMDCISPTVLVSAIAFKLILCRPSICWLMALAVSRSAAYTQLLSAASALNSFERSASVSVLLSAYDLRGVGIAGGYRTACVSAAKSLLVNHSGCRLLVPCTALTALPPPEPAVSYDLHRAA